MDKAKVFKTDWNKYYDTPYRTAIYSRKIITDFLIKLIEQFAKKKPRDFIRIAEIGGANSCFIDVIRKKISPIEYYVIDNNQLGLNKLRKRVEDDKSIFLLNHDILTSQLNLNLDLVYSIGVIEHFSESDMKKAIQFHFKLLKPHGILIISFPTPTLLYKISRFISESLGMWIFHDERPLTSKEVTEVISDYGKIKYEKILWPIFFTQIFMVVEKLEVER